jgi:cytochrome bd-type quinol oxidase subunit 1
VSRHVESARASLKIGLTLAPFSRLLQLVAGDSTAQGVANNQPTKLAAIEALEHSQRHAPLGIAAWVTWRRDAKGEIVGADQESFRFPGMLSIPVSGDFLHPAKAVETEVKGLAQLPSDEMLRRRHPGQRPEEKGRCRHPDAVPSDGLFGQHLGGLGLNCETSRPKLGMLASRSKAIGS